ncbi:DNA cytosine methyltransferase [Rhodobacteraceae bacterium]|nr:DNA cytosine methyltransferase [Paracoccaceae bacterium]
MTKLNCNNIDMIELFCGAGLFGAAFEATGFRSKFSADQDQDSIASLNRNHTSKSGAVHDVADTLQLGCDLLVAGPPCQGFSTLGKRDTKDERNELSLLLIEWAKLNAPKVVVIENVPQFQKSAFCGELIYWFEGSGYSTTKWVLDAQSFGAPQKRLRSFTIFSKIGQPVKPMETGRSTTVRDAFQGLLENSADAMHQAPPLSKLAKSRVECIPPNGGKYDVMERRPDLCPASWTKLGRQAVDVWGRMDFETASNTIRCAFQNPSKGRYLHPEFDRVITLREGARLQGVPDHWTFSGSRTSVARQIGNGVPLPLGKAIAQSIRQLFQNSSPSSSASIA